MNIWIVNPFDQLPNETDVPLRYWSLCKTFAAQGHDVIWWSSNFSHLKKAKREACPDTDGFSVRLIETPTYTKNISFARLKNHRTFADRFYHEAMEGLKNSTLNAPERIVVSLPPLGVAESAFKIREFVNRSAQQGAHNCQVVVDIQDAWPEVFYKVIPKPFQKAIGPILLAPLHRSAKRAYHEADKISAVGQSYLDLAQKYFGRERKVKSKKYQGRDLSTKISDQADTQEARNEELPTPTHLCYLGTDLSPYTTTIDSSSTPLNVVYLGAMGTSYDLSTLIQVAAKWKSEGNNKWKFHFAGDGQLKDSLQKQADSFGLDDSKIVWHGYLAKDAMVQLLQKADLGIVPNKSQTRVACPNKACEYAAASLPTLTCLHGEYTRLLEKWNAGFEYKEGDSASLHAAFEKYLSDPDRLKQQSANARKMAEALFDREATYAALAKFILITP